MSDMAYASLVFSKSCTVRSTTCQAKLTVKHCGSKTMRQADYPLLVRLCKACLDQYVADR